MKEKTLSLTKKTYVYNIFLVMTIYFRGALLLLLSAIVACQPVYKEDRQELALRYDTPAATWEETLPLGNGRIGMMPDGGIEQERVVLNDITMWSGSEDSTALNREAIDYLPEIRKLLLQGENLKAQEMMYHHFRCGGYGSAFGNGKDAPYGCFQLLGNLDIRYLYPESDAVEDYRRSLSLNDAMAATRFTRNNTVYHREYFASQTEDVLVIRLTADRKGAIAFEALLSRPERASLSAEEGQINMQGQLNDGYNGNKGVRYLTRMQIATVNGRVTTTDSSLVVREADEATIVIASATDLWDRNYEESVERLLTAALRMPPKELKKRHTDAYREKFDRVVVDLGAQDRLTSTDERLARYREDEDPAFAALYYQYGRYLMISGCRENGPPLNLQGLWANDVQTPWNGDYHLNINLQMNYWPAEVSNLSELHLPLIAFTGALVPSGEKTARTFYRADGWVAHMMSNPWHFSAPGEHASWGATNTGGAWLCAHLWEHYTFTQDKEYLESVYPVLAGAADFFLSSMIPEPRNGWLVTAPSSSPENAFLLPGSNKPVYVCMGPTMDVQLISELFNNVLSAAQILKREDSTVARIRETLPLLPPLQISPQGYLQEWLEDHPEVDPHHRHVSHLYALFPSSRITPRTTPELAAAARETLNRRGDAGTGWSRAWKINFWARLHDGNRAHKLLKSLLQPAYGDKGEKNRGGGTYPNLFCAHPPFQIDGNFGGASGIAEMLLQSHDGCIELLPALPDRWADGRFEGLCARGGAVIGARWRAGTLTDCTLKATADNTFRIKLPDRVAAVKQKGKTLPLEDGMVCIKMTKGETADLEVIGK